MAQVKNMAELPHLRSIRDRRKRVDLVNTEVLGARNIRGDMITYQPGDTAARHYHKDAEHFFYITAGEGVLHADDKSIHLQAGDVVLVSPGEIHWFENRSQAEFSFLEFWAPPPTETVWVDEGDQ